MEVHPAASNARVVRNMGVPGVVITPDSSCEVHIVTVDGRPISRFGRWRCERCCERCGGTRPTCCACPIETK